MATSDYTAKEIARFWTKVAITANPDKCWEWQAARSPNGYGLFYLKKQMGAHRAVWLLTHTTIPAGLYVLHKCDNPRCVNPLHLFLGTGLDNMQDKKRKGRGYIPQQGKHPWRCKLTDEEVVSIRQIYAAGGISYRKLGEKFNVVHGTVRSIVRYKSRKFVK